MFFWLWQGVKVPPAGKGYCPCIPVVWRSAIGQGKYPNGLIWRLAEVRQCLDQQCKSHETAPSGENPKRLGIAFAVDNRTVAESDPPSQATKKGRSQHCRRKYPVQQTTGLHAPIIARSANVSKWALPVIAAASDNDKNAPQAVSVQRMRCAPDRPGPFAARHVPDSGTCSGAFLLPGTPPTPGIPSVARWVQPRLRLVKSGR